MKKTISILGLALLAFSNVTLASNVSDFNRSEAEKFVYAKYYATPLCIAISKGELDVVKKMVSYGADVNEKTNGMTPLMYAARYNQTEIMEFLMEKGADVKAKCKNGFTALKHAELSNATEAVQLLKSK
ncbi:ankyrin repeat domain-containing protein [Flavobacterium sp. UBA6135]|uniref:ankyrin repeat domain-containing protein n=1 Tax=Flavobacterium sp. UBA6135 TaxID=1946553 RepID=UPI0025BBE012|nr:ankyrin repeat domain-containing protein [Flavobacterium sp. UBA6135]